MNYLLDKLPELEGMEWVSIDLEMFGQDKERLHIPHGEFACLSLSFSNGTDGLIATSSLLQEVMDQLQEIPSGFSRTQPTISYNCQGSVISNHLIDHFITYGIPC